MVVLVNSETSNSVNSLNFAMCAFPSEVFPHGAGPMFRSMAKNSMTNNAFDATAASLVDSVVQIVELKGAILELPLAIGGFRPTFIEAHLTMNMICKVRSLKSRIITPSFLEDIITSNNAVFIDSKSDIVVGIESCLTPVERLSKVTLLLSRTLVLKYWLLRYTKDKSKTCETVHAWWWSCIQGHTDKTDGEKLHLRTIQCISLRWNLLSPT